MVTKNKEDAEKDIYTSDSTKTEDMRIKIKIAVQ